jgi:ankyrin repeat protein
MSAERGDVKMTTFLCEEVSLDPNRKDERRLAPLHAAAKQGILAVLEELLDWKEADVESKSTKGYPHMLADIDTMATEECRRYGLPEELYNQMGMYILRIMLAFAKDKYKAASAEGSKGTRSTASHSGRSALDGSAHMPGSLSPSPK